MAMIIDEKRMVEDNFFKYENRLKSSVSRFLETTPTFVDYYHINNNETTTDTGFKDVASILGFRSPIRFNRIESFPLYGIEQITLQLSEQDQGLDSGYEGEAVIVPGSIKPLPNDLFMIPYLKEPYIFRVTEVNYDNIMPDNYYKISYKLEWLDEDKVINMKNQVKEEYTCILENIGTENNCIIELKSKELLDKIDNMYNDIASTYKSVFYNERHNCFLGEMGPGLYLYDPFQSQFINDHQLFNKKNDLSCLMLTDEFTDPKRRIKYERSLYRFIERRDHTLVKNFGYDIIAGVKNHETSFYRYLERNIYYVDIPGELSDKAKKIFSDEYVSAIKYNGETKHDYATLIKKFVRNDTLEISDIPLTLNDELLQLDGNLEVFFFTPIIMYIIKEVVSEFINKK